MRCIQIPIGIKRKENNNNIIINIYLLIFIVPTCLNLRACFTLQFLLYASHVERYASMHYYFFGICR